MKILWICFVLIFGIKLSKSSYKCIDAACRCIQITDQPLEIQCPRFTPENYNNYTGIHVLQEKKSFSIECCSIKRFHGGLLPAVTAGQVKFLVIRYCPMSSIKNIYEHFEMSDAEVFYYYANFENVTLSKHYNFVGYENLKKLKLHRLTFSGIDDDVFDNMSNLLFLELRWNKNLALTSSIFKSLTRLKHLSLANNELKSLPDKIFANLSDLSVLHLWGNRLTIIDENTFQGLSNLTSLELSNNAIEIISEDAFKSLTQLFGVNLSKNRITVLHPRVFVNNKMIINISVSHNKNLTLFDYTFGNLPLVEKVDLSFCNLGTIPGHIFENSVNLKKLFLDNNKLERLPDTLLKGLVNLRIVNLSRNRISAIDKNLFEDLTRLEKINLSENRISRISLCNKKYLDVITVSHNKLEEERIVFEDLPSLKKIDLSYNFLEDVNTIIRSLRNLLKLNRLDLSHNNIHEVCLQDFQLFEKMFVNLQFNNINRIDFSVVEGKIISLGNNLIDCNCNAFGLLQYLKRHSYKKDINFQISTENLTCGNPSHLRGHKLELLELSELTCPEREGCPENCICNWRPFDKTVVVNCSSRNLTTFPEVSIRSLNLFNQTELHLEGNLLSVGPNRPLKGYENVTKLFLSRNQIRELTWFPPNLEVLALDNNYLNRLDDNFLHGLSESNLTHLTLAENPWSCDCRSINFTYFLRSHTKMVHDMGGISCSANRSQLLINLDNHEVCDKWIVIFYCLVAAFLGVAITMAILFGFFFKYQYDIKVWLFARDLCTFLLPEEKPDGSKTYDAFISFAPEDQDFVLENLLPVLEGGPRPYKICLPVRDMIPGEFKTTQVTSLILNSRRTLVVLSQNFVRSVWAQMEIRTAHTQAMTEAKSSVIIVLYGGVEVDKLDDELQMHLKTNTYMKWGDSYFWKKLKYALPHYKRNAIKNSKTITDIIS